MQTAEVKSHYEALIAAIDVMNSAPEDPDMSSAFPRQIEHLPLNKNRGSVCGHKKGENMQSCEMSRIWRIYPCKKIGRLV